MHNINKIFKDKESYFKKIERRGASFKKEAEILEKLNTERKKLILDIEAKKAHKNNCSKQVGELLKNMKAQEAESIKKEISQLNEEISIRDQKLNFVLLEIKNILSTIPNIIDDSVVIGKDEKDNKEIRRWEGNGLIKNKKEHDDIGHELNLINIKQAVKLSGSRFAMYTNNGSKLIRAVTDVLLNINAKNGFQENWLPLLVNREIMYGTGQLPKFEDDAYKTSDGQFLIPTAEVALVNLLKDEVVEEQQLPIKYTAFTQCFRKESGSSGKDTKGLIRLHQFNKVELVEFTKPEDSFTELEKMVNVVEEVLKTFKLPYRVLELCSGDIGFSSAKTYDLEVWIPSQNKFREISSCSNCLDFQAQRANLKYRDKDKKLQYMHTLNGSSIAIDRLFAAILEHYYEGGKLRIPEVLRKYFDNKEFL